MVLCNTFAMHIYSFLVLLYLQQYVDCILFLHSYHPYIFFNRDWTYTEEVEYDSMTFVGFNLQQVGRTVQLLDLQNQIIEPNIMSDGLYQWLRVSKVETRQDPDAWSK